MFLDALQSCLHSFIYDTGKGKTSLQSLIQKIWHHRTSDIIH